MIDCLRNTSWRGVNTRSGLLHLIRLQGNSSWISTSELTPHRNPRGNCSVIKVRCTLLTIEGTINIYVSTEASRRTAKGIDSTKGPHAGHIENTIGTSMRAYSVEPYEKKKRKALGDDQDRRALIFTPRNIALATPYCPRSIFILNADSSTRTVFPESHEFPTPRSTYDSTTPWNRVNRADTFDSVQRFAYAGLF